MIKNEPSIEGGLYTLLGGAEGIILNQNHYTLTITPAISPDNRHQIEDCLKRMGYKIRGGGTMTDLTSCDISFE